MMTVKQVALALAETLGETKATMIEGHAYARMMGVCDLETFNAAVQLLVAKKLITVEHHHMKATPELISLCATNNPASQPTH